MKLADSIRNTPIFVLLVLTFASAIANAGASLLSACLPLMKAEFGYSDTQLGLLSGYASALTFAVLALPISAWAIRWGNSRVFGICLIICSLSTALTAACSSFWQILAARFGSGFGPASEFPLGQAIVSDYYPPEKRSGALAIYSLGYFAGVTGGLALGGYLASQLGWRHAFIVFSFIGVFTAIIQMAFAKDSKKTTSYLSEPNPIGGLKAVKELVNNSLFLHITVGASWASFATFGLVQWMPSFYNRQFELPPEQAAAFFGGAYAVGALFGLLSGGAIGNKFGSSSTARMLKFCMISFALTFPLIGVVLFSSNLYLAFAAHVAATFVGSMPNGPILAMIHNELPRDRRVLGSSMFLLAQTVLGAGGGPLIIGFLSDTLQSSMGNESLRWAMLFVKLLGLLLFVNLGYALWKVTRNPMNENYQ